MHALTVLTLLAAFLTLLTTNFASAYPIPPPLELLEPELRAISAAAGFNTTTLPTTHHVLHALNRLSTPERVALAVNRQLIALNYSVDPETALCYWLSRSHRSSVANIGSYGDSLAVQNGTSVESSSAAENSASTAAAAENANDNSATEHAQHVELAFDYEACANFMASGMRGARLLAHRLQALQKENVTLPTGSDTQPGSAVEKRNTKFLIWHNGFSFFVCHIIPSWCHEEDRW